LPTETLTSEQLVSAYLKRIEAHDKQGPAINAIITLNKRALDEARQRDAERKSRKARGPLHGIPVVLKDNYDTADMPTTAGSQLLEGHIAKQDAFMVKKLREAGAVSSRTHRFVGKLGMYLIRVMPEEPPAGNQAPESSFIRVVMSNGKVGFVAAEFLSPTEFDQLCYVKDASGWKIAGYNGTD
jgi:Amidase